MYPFCFDTVYGYDRVPCVDPLEDAAVDIDDMGVSLLEQSFRNTLAAVPHRTIDCYWCVSINSDQPGQINIVVAHPGGSGNMDHCKFSVCSGIQYTILPQLTLAIYPLLRSDEGVVGRRGWRKAA